MSRPIYAPVQVQVLRHFSPLFFALALVLPTAEVLGQCTLVCKQNIQVSLNQSGQAPITVQIIAPTAANLCPGPLEVQLFDEQGHSLSDDTLRCPQVGETVTAVVRHTASGNNCSGTIQVHDALSPVLSCPEKMVFCTESTDPGAVGTPEMTDNCTPSGSLETIYVDNSINFPCGSTHGGFPITARLDRTWYVHDESNNTATCIERIWIRQATVADVVFPANLDNIARPSLNCGQNPENLDLTGEPTLHGQPLSNSSGCEVAATYTDQIGYFCPPAGYTVIRNWTLVDFCSSNIAQRIQIIKVEDKTPPVLTPPAALTVGTNPYQCAATVTLPTATATDNCSAVTITTAWAYGNGYGPFPNVPPGDYLITYTATDACGNTASKTTILTVVDDTPPQAVCKGSIQVSLTANGTAMVNAAVLDGGSTDNCGSVSFSISRDGIQFLPVLSVTCADIGGPILLTLRVEDDNQLENFCQMQASVRDFLKPSLQCPANVTLTCRQTYTDQQLTGKATASDNCAMQSLNSTDVVSLSSCNTGSATRTWKATDASANTRTCIQTITLKAVSNVLVVFPAHTSVLACDSTVSTAPTATGQPMVTGEFCYPLSVTYTDQVFQTAPPSCLRILRKWKVVDFCVYDVNISPTTGYWEYTQFINVRDDLPPVLSLPADLTVSPDQSGCIATVNLPVATATDCSAKVVITHNSSFASLPGADASGFYPVGEHLVTFVASDGCGNIAQQTLKITVQDITPPAVICISGLTLNVPPSGSVIFQATALNGGSTDNCTPANELQFVTTPAGFNCQSLGVQEVALRVTDAAGNISTCMAQVTVQDNTNVCGGGNHNLDGSIRTAVGTPVNEIPIRLTGDLYSETVDCDTAGHFAFTDVPGGKRSYALRPRNNANWINGVTTYDLVLISKHILGLQPLPDVYHMIAADANHSNTITTFDIVLLRQIILGITDSIAANTSWRFVPSDFVFTQPDNPFANGGFPEEIPIPDLQRDSSGLDFVGIKIGDTNLSTNTTDPRSPNDTVFLAATNVRLSLNTPVAIPILLENWSPLTGFQFEIGFDTALVQLEKIEFSRPALLTAANVAVRPDGSGVAVSWNDLQAQPSSSDSALFCLHLLPRQTTDLRDAIFISTKKLSAESYFIEKQGVGNMALRFDDLSRTRLSAFTVFPPQPNPFSEGVQIPYFLPQATELLLTLSDAQGRIVLSRRQNALSGYGDWTIQRDELPGSGVFFYRMQAGDGSVVVGKVVRGE